MPQTPSQRHREGQHSEPSGTLEQEKRPADPKAPLVLGCQLQRDGLELRGARILATGWAPARRPRENAPGQEAPPGPGLPSHIALQVWSHGCRPRSCSQNEKNPENPAPCSQLEWPDDDRDVIYAAPGFALMGWSAPSEQLWAPSKGVVGSEAHAGCGCSASHPCSSPAYLKRPISKPRWKRERACCPLLPPFPMCGSQQHPVTSARPQGRGFPQAFHSALIAGARPCPQREAG